MPLNRFVTILVSVVAAAGLTILLASSAWLASLPSLSIVSIATLCICAGLWWTTGRHDG